MVIRMQEIWVNLWTLWFTVGYVSHLCFFFLLILTYMYYNTYRPAAELDECDTDVPFVN